ncbi:site-specific integrase [Pseudomonas sp. LF-5]|uniref:site-specific integrase n=1 Tax=Pseudomonas sp. LF-5 TaxID=3031121 RepID=UPI0030AE97D3
MARVEYIEYSPSEITINAGELARKFEPVDSFIKRLPQIMWRDGKPWREANLWAIQRAKSNEVDIKTVISQCSSLVYYATWLEAVGMNWWDFPARKDERCLIKFRGSLIKERDSGVLSPSTATKRMRDTISFYRWLDSSRLLVTEWPMWMEKKATIIVNNKYGFERTLTIPSTDLAIKNRRRPGDRLEDGLLPVSSADRDIILNFAARHGSIELHLLLTLGFYTGMRIGTLCDLRIETINNATPDPTTKELYRLTVGPGAVPKVSTKYSVTGQVWITRRHRDAVLEYYYNPRRLLREAKALPGDKTLVFLTRYGKPYIRPDGAQNSAINVEMFNLRKKAAKQNIKSLKHFHFHQTRCTFATELAKILIPISGSINALAIIKEALLHRDEATTLKYIKFVEKAPAKAAFANEFTRSFLKANIEPTS